MSESDLVFDDTRELPAQLAAEVPRPVRARLVMLTGPEAGRTYRLGEEFEHVIGRGPNSQVLIGVPAVSRRHAVIRHVSARAYVLIDLRSSNGTQVNGAPVSNEVALAFGDRVTLGSAHK